MMDGIIGLFRDSDATFIGMTPPNLLLVIITLLAHASLDAKRGNELCVNWPTDPASPPAREF